MHRDMPYVSAIANRATGGSRPTTQKLEILSDTAKRDAACASSGGMKRTSLEHGLIRPQLMLALGRRRRGTNHRVSGLSAVTVRRDVAARQQQAFVTI